MRLRDIQTIINQHNVDLTVGNKPIPNDNQNKKIDNLQSFNNSFLEIERMKIFQEEIKELKRTEAVFLTHHDSISLPNNAANTFHSQLNNLKTKLTTFNQGISSVIPEQDENSISIKLPKINDLKELINISKALDTIFNQTLVTKKKKFEAKLQNFDTGSEWIEIVITGSVGLSIFSKIIHTAILLKREHLKNNHFKETIRRERTVNDNYEKILDMLTKQLNDDLNSIKNDATTEIVKKMQINIDDEPEYPNRIKNSIDSITKLINIGMQFFPSSNATQEVKEILPDFTKELKDMLPEIKKLENKE